MNSYKKVSVVLCIILGLLISTTAIFLNPYIVDYCNSDYIKSNDSSAIEVIAKSRSADPHNIQILAEYNGELFKAFYYINTATQVEELIVFQRSVYFEDRYFYLRSSRSSNSFFDLSYESPDIGFIAVCGNNDILMAYSYEFQIADKTYCSKIHSQYFLDFYIIEDGASNYTHCVFFDEQGESIFIRS